MKVLYLLPSFLLFAYLLHTCANDNEYKETGKPKKEKPAKTNDKTDRLTGTLINTEPGNKNELQALDKIIGRWINVGKTIPVGNEPAIEITTSDVFEWAPGKQFVIHYAYGKAGTETGGAVELIGYDQQSKKYKTHCFDSYGIISAEEVILQDSVWIFQGQATRCRLAFNNDNNVTYGHHERLNNDGKTWEPSMEVVLTKVN